MTTLTDKANQVQADFESGERALYGSEGEQLYAAHEERVSELLTDRNRSLAEIEAQAGGQIAAAERELRDIENADPAGTLSPSELERANAMRALVADEVAMLSGDELRDRLRSVLSGGDRGTVLVYWQAARRREHERLEGLREELRNRGRSPGAAQGIAPELAVIFTEMEQQLMPDKEARLEATRSRLDEARAAQSLAWSLRRGGKTPTIAYLNRKYG